MTPDPENPIFIRNIVRHQVTSVGIHQNISSAGSNKKCAGMRKFGESDNEIRSGTRQYVVWSSAGGIGGYTRVNMWSDDHLLSLYLKDGVNCGPSWWGWCQPQSRSTLFSRKGHVPTVLGGMLSEKLVFSQHPGSVGEYIRDSEGIPGGIISKPTA